MFAQFPFMNVVILHITLQNLRKSGYSNTLDFRYTRIDIRVHTNIVFRFHYNVAILQYEVLQIYVCEHITLWHSITYAHRLYIRV